MSGNRLTQIDRIKEAVTICTQGAAEKLHVEDSLCRKIRVTIRTGTYSPEEAKDANGCRLRRDGVNVSRRGNENAV